VFKPLFNPPLPNMVIAIFGNGVLLSYQRAKK